MKFKNYILVSLILVMTSTAFAQQGRQRRADTLFNKFSFVKAAEVYKDLIRKNYNKDYATRRLADCYAYMRNPAMASRYYKRVVKQKNVPIEYYYSYAQSLRGIKKYDESREWLQRFKDSGGVSNTIDFERDLDFISHVFNAKKQYFLKRTRLNSKFSDFGALEHNGKIYFTSSRDEGIAVKRLYGWNEQPFLDIYVTEKGSKRRPDHTYKLKGDVNSLYHDGPVTISNDGKTMYFSRNKANRFGKETDKKGVSNMNIYRATFKDSIWTDVEDLSINSKDFSTQHPALNNDNTRLYFTSDMPGGFGGSDIYYVDINPDGTLGEPVNVGEIVNTKDKEGTPFINNEGILFFSSDGHFGLGLLDIYGTITDDDGNIADIVNLGVPVNSEKDDFSFSMNPDGLTGYFSSNRRGGRGSDDIYEFYRKPLLNVRGQVVDAINTKPIPNAKIKLLDADGNQIADMITDKDGFYEINIDRNKDYKIVGSQNKYIDDYREFTSKRLSSIESIIVANLILNPKQEVVVLADLSLNTIYFDFDSNRIREDAKKELDKIVGLMTTDYPEMVIRIESHTDSRGSLSYNDRLSIDRANATYEYLISKGIDADRITEHKGFGERRLTNGCEDGAKCEEGDHQLNRRTQFIVVKME
ncbi:OmpA family protein [Hyunsoonleella sp. SJ7]|uniref:OmpA family protein n=1 Tax=Hyunsoonleella aquatilis TaxID=2762758 RepID=A0A923KLI6_9FLAO|nr:OmpA family protein [Hyunsoonleella aquatilis]MBC3759517.1 OmpA family protein [Hyunsoonleella aquatilis]